MVELRPYQKKAVAELRNGFLKYKRQVLCSPTGSGKTVIFSSIAYSSVKKKKRVIIITDRTELCDQTYKSVARHGEKVEFIRPGESITDNSMCVVAMVETLNNRIKSGMKWQPDLVIIDEAHKGNFSKIINHWPDVYVIGATATPVGKHFFELYENIVEVTDIDALINEGFLAPCKAFQMQDDLSDLKKSGKDYTDKSLFEHYDKPKLYDGVVDKWKEKAVGLKTLVFCVNIKHTEQTFKAFVSGGVSADFITSKTKKEDRDRIINAHKKGMFTVLINCGILTTGYDDPSIQCIVMNRATLSLPLFLQCCGRGSRIYPEKKEFLILDFGMNHDRFGRWDAPRVWELKQKKEKKEQAAPVKICPNCEAMLFASARTCQYCGYVFQKKDELKKGGELVEVLKQAPIDLVGKKLSELTLDELFELQETKRYKATYIWRVVRSRGEEAVQEYADIASYSFNWAMRQNKELDNSDFFDKVIN